MKVIKTVIKKVAYAAVLLYGYNLISTQLNMMIPINIYSVLMISILGNSGLILLVLFKYLIL